MTFEQFRHKVQYDEAHPLLIGDRSFLYVGSWKEGVSTAEDVVIRIVAENRFGHTAQGPRSFHFGGQHYQVYSFALLEPQLQQLICQYPQAEEPKRSTLEAQLLEAFGLQPFCQEQTVIAIKEAFGQQAYEEVAKALFYDYKHLIVPDRELYLIMAFLCREGLGTFPNPEQAALFERLASQAAIGETSSSPSPAAHQRPRSKPAGPSVWLQARQHLGALYQRIPAWGRKAAIGVVGALLVGWVSWKGVSYMQASSPRLVGEIPEGSAAPSPSSSDRKEAYDTAYAQLLSMGSKWRKLSVAKDKLQAANTFMEEVMKSEVLNEEDKRKLGELLSRMQACYALASEGKKDLFWIGETAQAGETLEWLAKKHEVDAENIRDARFKTFAKDTTFKGGEVLKVGIPAVFFDHTVGSGEHLNAICKRYGMQMAEMRKLNNLTGDVIRQGQVLRVYLRQ